MQVKGNILTARRKWIIETFGEASWRRVLEALPEADRELLQGIISALGWYPFEVSLHLDEAIVDVVGGGDTAMFEEIGRASAKQNLAFVHKSFLVPGDPQAFMHNAQIIYEYYYDTGHRTYEPTGPSSGVLTTFDAETFSAADCATVIGWYKEALAMCGAKDVTMVEEECRATGGVVCRYRVGWTLD